MSMIDAIPLLAGAGADGYQISRSVRLRSSATAYFNRTLTTPTSQNIWSFSCWVKRGSLAKSQFLLWAGTLSTNDCALYFSSSDQIGWFTNNGSSVLSTSTAVFRDPSAWYHIVAIANSTTMNVYVNNQQVITNAGMTNNTINSAIVHNIGRDGQTAGNEFDGYLTEINFIDGQALTPSSFGETNAVTGVWQPKRYAGTYGTNGFYLPFSDNASLTRLGFDQRSSATVYANGWRNSFNGSASLTAATNAAFAVGTNNFTIEAWIKPTSQAGQIIFVASNGIQVGYQNTTTWGLCQANVAWQLTTTTVPTLNAWNHIVVVRSGTGANQTAIFLNGTRVAQGTISTSYAQNSCVVGSGIIGDLTNVRLVNGTAIYDPTQTTLTVPTAPLSNVANTAILTCQNETFVDNSSNAFSLTNSATTSARDSTFNTCNDWTPSAGISITAGVTYDSMLDVPTPYADGGNGRGNYAVLNPLFRNASMISEGNLYFNKSTIGWATGQATMPLPASKTYFEATATLIGGANSGVFIGIATASATQDSYQIANQWSFGGTGGTLKLYNQTTLVTPAGSSAANDIFQVAYDGATGYLWFGKNNTWYDSAGGTTGDPSTGANPTMTLTAGTEVFPCAICYANGLKFTFGQRPFTYTPPTGFKALNTLNLPTPTILKGNQFFDIDTYTGNATARSRTGFQFAPDFVWNKRRSISGSHQLYDTVRAAGNYLSSDLTAAEAFSANLLTSFDSSGYSIGTATGINASGETFVSWQWNAGGNTVTNTDGTISSQVRANATAGFSIVTYTGTGANATVGHGLGVAPSMVIVKCRTGTSSDNWAVWHSSFAGGSSVMYLNLTNAVSNTATTMWNSTVPTSSVFSIGTADTNRSNGYTYVAYCFAAVAGYSAFGSYTGNNSTDGVFVYLGFRPRFIMIKSTSVGTEWVMIDTARSLYNLSETSLYANRDYSESTIGTVNDVDILSNGFKLRNNTGFVNASQTYIYAAFSEVGFKYALGR